MINDCPSFDLRSLANKTSMFLKCKSHSFCLHCIVLSFTLSNIADMCAVTDIDLVTVMMQVGSQLVTGARLVTTARGGSRS